MDRILVIDDSAVQIEFLNSILKNDYEITMCQTAADGLRAAKEGGYSLILLDVVMPDMDGFTLIRELKATDLTRHVPVIMITGLADIQYEERGLLLGAAGINAELDILSVWRHPVQRFRLARELLAKLDVAYENATYVQLCNERVIEVMQLCYAGEYYYGFPLAKRAVALREYEAEFFDDAELQALATVEWESSSIYKQFGEENILRAHMLQRYVNHRITFYRPVMAGAVSSFRRCYTESEVHKLYPELPEELYVYCYFG